MTGSTGVLGRTVDFLLYVSSKFEFSVFLSCDTMLMQYIPSSCVHLCGVDVVYRWLSDDLTHLQWSLHS